MSGATPPRQAAASDAPAPPMGAFALVWFSYFGAMGAFNPFAPLWFKDLGFTTLAIGTIASLQSWSRVLAPYAWAWLGDHGVGRVRLLRWATVGSALAAMLLLWTRGYGAVALATTLLFLANGGVVPLAEATLSRHLTTAAGMDVGRYGRVRVWGSLGFVAAVMVFGVLYERAGISLFPVVAVVAWAWLALAARRLPASAEPPHGADATPAVWPVLRQPSVLWFFASVFFTVLAHTSQYTFFSLFLDSHGHGKQTVGLMWAVGAGVEVAFFWWQGRFFQRIGPYGWLQGASLLAAVRFAGTAALGGQVWLLFALQALHAITFAAHHAACITLVTRHFPGALRGRGQALYTVLGYGLSGVIGGVAGGWLSSHGGLEAVFWAAAAAAVAGGFCARRAAQTASQAGLPAR